MPKHFASFIESQTYSAGVLIVSQKLEISRAIDEIILIWQASEAKEYGNSIRQLPI
jgi:hypothetical protein